MEKCALLTEVQIVTHTKLKLKVCHINHSSVPVVYFRYLVPINSPTGNFPSVAVKLKFFYQTRTADFSESPVMLYLDT